MIQLKCTQEEQFIKILEYLKTNDNSTLQEFYQFARSIANEENTAVSQMFRHTDNHHVVSPSTIGLYIRFTYLTEYDDYFELRFIFEDVYEIPPYINKTLKIGAIYTYGESAEEQQTNIFYDYNLLKDEIHFKYVEKRLSNNWTNEKHYKL